jgi:hypothetical protein
MSPDDFKNLQYGNLIRDNSGNVFVVTQAVRNAAGEVFYIGITPGVTLGDCAGFELVSKISTQTFLIGKSVQPLE